MAAARESRKLHGQWTNAPATRDRFDIFVKRFVAREPASHAGYLALLHEDDSLVGVFNFSEMVRGAFQSTYLGYYAFAARAGRGYMTEGMALALDVAFRKQKLHRVEVNIQPTNSRSLALAERIGFSREGYSPRYVKIAGRWRDHVRYAMLAEQWRTLRREYLGRHDRSR
jgi:ribosomal-protein-alanine N-acetyltransferase